MNTHRTSKPFIRLRILVGLMCCSTLFFCSQGGTDVDNAIVKGNVVREGLATARVNVYVMHSEYNPMKEGGITQIWTAETNSKGYFELQGIPSGKYSIEFKTQSEQAMDWVPNWDIAEGQVKEINADLKKIHYLNIKIDPALMTDDLYLYIPGSNSFSLAKDNLYDSTHVVLKYVAETNIPYILYGYALDPNFVSQVLVSDIPAPVQDTVYIEP